MQTRWEVCKLLAHYALLRLAARRCFRRTGASARKVWFTVAASGNTSRTSGSITATLAPWAYLAAVAPRTAGVKSYSARRVSRSYFRLRRLAFLFFISNPFLSSSLSGGDKSRPRWPFSERYNQYPSQIRGPKQQVALLVVGMIGSGIDNASGSPKTDDASSNVTPCLRALDAAFFASHSKTYPNASPHACYPRE